MKPPPLALLWFLILAVYALGLWLDRDGPRGSGSEFEDNPTEHHEP